MIRTSAVRIISHLTFKQASTIRSVCEGLHLAQNFIPILYVFRENQSSSETEKVGFVASRRHFLACAAANTISMKYLIGAHLHASFEESADSFNGRLCVLLRVAHVMDKKTSCTSKLINFTLRRF